MLMKRYASRVVGFLVVVAMAWYFLLSASTPKGQPALTYLETRSPGQFGDLFNQASGTPRIVLLLSPT